MDWSFFVLGKIFCMYCIYLQVEKYFLQSPEAIIFEIYFTEIFEVKENLLGHVTYFKEQFLAWCWELCARDKLFHGASRVLYFSQELTVVWPACPLSRACPEQLYQQIEVLLWSAALTDAEYNN